MLAYEQRLSAKTAISRPVMKQFKALIREQGLLDNAKLIGDYPKDHSVSQAGAWETESGV